jgi:hypothetical protein
MAALLLQIRAKASYLEFQGEAGCRGGVVVECLEVPSRCTVPSRLRTQLAKLLEKEPDLAPQLQTLLSEAKPQGDVMTQNVGEGGKASQIKGDQNTVSIA